MRKWVRFILLSYLLSMAIQVAASEAAAVFEDGFDAYPNGSDGAPKWLPIKGQWRVVDGTYRQFSGEYDCAAMFADFTSGDFELQFRFQVKTQNPGAGLFFNAHRRNSTRFSHMLRLESKSTLLIGYFDEGNYNVTAIANVPELDLSQWHCLRVTVRAGEGVFDVELDGNVVASAVPLKYRAGYWGLESSAGETWFDDVRLVATRAAKGPEFYWASEFAIHQERFYIPVPHGGYVGVYSQSGAEFGRLGVPRSQKGWLAEPVAVAVAESGEIYVSDAGANAVHKMAPDGAWLASVGWQGKGNGEFSEPVALALRDSTLFVVDRGNRRLQAFDLDLKWLASFGQDALRDPVDVAVRNDTVAVLDAGEFRIFLFRWHPEKHQAVLLHSIPSGYTHPRALAFGPRGIYVSRGNEVALLDFAGKTVARLQGWALRGIVPWGNVWDGTNLWVLDYGVGRLLKLGPGLRELWPSIVHRGRDRVEIRWESEEPVSYHVRVSRGDSLVAERVERSPARRHKFSVGDLQPSTVYHVEFLPAIQSVPKWMGPPRPFPFISPPPEGKTQFVALRAVAIVFANVRDPKYTGPNGEWPPPLSEAEIQRIVAQVEDGIRFYWMNSGMRFFIDLDTVVVRRPVEREEIFANLSYYPPAEGMIERLLQEAGKDPDEYRAVFYIACVQKWLSDEERWELAGRGGAFTSGLGANGKYGVSWWEATHAHHFSGNNWLVVHEFHHQLDELFMLSGYPEYWFNHFSPSIGTAADFGEHFDGNAYLLRNWPEPFWFDLRYAEIRTADDADSDGIPDDDARLPMDERRLRSNPQRTDTDGDGVSDYDEIGLSNWVVEGVEETYGGGQIFPNLVWKDADGDGLSDGKDPAPLYPVEPRIKHATPQLDGKLAPGEWPLFAELKDVRVNATVHAAWDTSALYLGFDLERPVPFKVQIDGEADGWFLGRDNLRIEVSPDTAGDARIKLRLLNCAVPDRWPFEDAQLAGKVKVQATSRVSEKGRWVVEMAIKRCPEVGMDCSRGERIGLLFGFLVPFDEFGHKRYVDLFEPNRLFDIELVEAERGGRR